MFIVLYNFSQTFHKITIGREVQMCDFTVTETRFTLFSSVFPYSEV